VKVLDKGFVELIQSMADDLIVVNSARVSFNKSSAALELKDKKLIKFLMENHHETPFEHCVFTFRIKCPIFVAREWFRHRIGSFNEWSGRYSVLEDEFYIPDKSAVRTQVGKPGAYTFLPWEDPASPPEAFQEALVAHCEASYDLYQYWLDKGVAKELTRIFLPVNIYTQFYWTVNARSLMNFIKLRNAPDALLEIREYAKIVEALFEQAMPITYEAYVSCNK